MGVLLFFINYLAVPVSHVLTICWWIHSSYWQYRTWGHYPPIAPAEFAKPPQNKLSIGSFPETLHGKIEIICTDITSSLDANFKDVPVKADIVECLKSCNTGHPLTTNIFDFIRHWSTHITFAPLKRNLIAPLSTCWHGKMTGSTKKRSKTYC